MNTLLPNDVVHHATMLADKQRLDVYRNAIAQNIKAKDRVVEIGSGTGILSAMAARHTEETIYAIEYFEKSAAASRQLLRQAGLNKKVQVLNQSSYRCQLQHNPTVVVTETMGAIGPEENMVELAYDFKQRHPSIERFLPYELKIFAVPVFSRDIELEKELFLNSFLGTQEGDFNFLNLEADLRWSFAQRFSCLSVKNDIHELTPPQLLAHYTLGQTKNSAFSAEVLLPDSTLPNNMLCNAVHIFFETPFDQNNLLSSHYKAPWTHWKHTFVPAPANAANLKIAYNKQEWSLTWTQQ